MECWSCADHLTVAGSVLAGHQAIASLYTITRAGAEAASTACYLSEPGIESLERIRRLMNHNLVALHEDLNILSRFSSPDAAKKAARHRAQETAIARTGHRHGLPFTRPKKGYSPRFLGDKPPSAMTLIDQCASRTSGVGATYQQLLSSVAHGQMHGLSRFLMRAPAPSRPGKVITQMNISARDLSLPPAGRPTVRIYACGAPALVLRLGHRGTGPSCHRHDAYLGAHRRSALRRSRAVSTSLALGALAASGSSPSSGIPSPRGERVPSGARRYVPAVVQERDSASDQARSPWHFQRAVSVAPQPGSSATAPLAHRFSNHSPVVCPTPARRDMGCAASSRRA